MTMLSIDPGTKHLGWAIYADGRPIADGLWNAENENPLLFLYSFETFLSETDAAYPFDLIASEAMFQNTAHGGNTRALLNLVPRQAECWAKKWGKGFVQYYPSTVKKAVTGSGRADKKQVYQEVEHLLSEASKRMTIKDGRRDVSDAHGVALTAFLHHYKPITTKK